LIKYLLNVYSIRNLLRLHKIKANLEENLEFAIPALERKTTLEVSDHISRILCYITFYTVPQMSQLRYYLDHFEIVLLLFYRK